MREGVWSYWLAQLIRRKYPAPVGADDRVHVFQKISQLFGKIQLERWGICDWHGLRGCFIAEMTEVDDGSLTKLCRKARLLDLVVAHEKSCQSALASSGHRIVLFPRYLNPFKCYSPMVLKAVKGMGYPLDGNAPRMKEYRVIEHLNDKRLLGKLLKSELNFDGNYFEQRSYIAKRCASGFQLLCTADSESEAKEQARFINKLRRSKKKTQSVFAVSATRIDDETAIKIGNLRYYTNEGQLFPFVYVHRILSAKTGDVENLLRRILGTKLKEIVREPVDNFGLRRLIVVQRNPISGAVAKQLSKIIDRELARSGKKGCCRIPLPYFYRMLSEWEEMAVGLSVNLT